jgi:hypothetical protein
LFLVKTVYPLETHPEESLNYLETVFYKKTILNVNYKMVFVGEPMLNVASETVF